MYGSGLKENLFVLGKFWQHLRRVTMHRTLILAACTALLSSVGAKLALAEGDLQKVNHIIIVMQGNHSFDNYFGALAYVPGSPSHNAIGPWRPRDHKCG